MNDASREVVDHVLIEDGETPGCVSLRPRKRLLTMAACLATLAMACDRVEHPASSAPAKPGISITPENAWLPRWLPPSATDLRESPTGIGNQKTATFRYTPGDIATTQSNCHQIPSSDDNLKFICLSYDQRSATVILMKDGSGSAASR